MQRWNVDERYLPTFQIQLKGGRNISASYPTDSSGVIINETAAKLFAGANPVNKKLYMVTDLSTGKLVAYHVIGVIKDFNFSSLRDLVQLLVLNLQEDNSGMAVRINTHDIPGLLNEIKDKWTSMVASQPFSYSFLDEEFDKQYSVDQRTGKIFGVF